MDITHSCVQTMMRLPKFVPLFIDLYETNVKPYSFEDARNFKG
jgi:hypothetical protein